MVQERPVREAKTALGSFVSVIEVKKILVDILAILVLQSEHRYHMLINGRWEGLFKSITVLHSS